MLLRKGPTSHLPLHDTRQTDTMEIPLTEILDRIFTLSKKYILLQKSIPQKSCKRPFLFSGSTCWPKPEFAKFFAKSGYILSAAKCAKNGVFSEKHHTACGSGGIFVRLREQSLVSLKICLSFIVGSISALIFKNKIKFRIE